MHIRYLYLRNDQNAPVACLAYVANKDSNKAMYGLATFNPSDKRVSYRTFHNTKTKETFEKQVIQRVAFDRKFLREVATGRLLCDKKEVTHGLDNCSDLRPVIRSIVQTIATDPMLPKRTKKAVFLWLDRDAEAKKDTND